MKKIRKYSAAMVLAAVLMICFVVPTYAADGFGGGDRGDGWAGDGFHTGTVATYLSFNALSEYCIEQNALIASGVYDSQEPFSSAKTAGLNLSATVRYDSYHSLYFISVRYQGTWYDLKNKSGSYYCAEYNDAALLDNIRVHISNLHGLLESGFSNINVSLNTLIERLNGLSDIVFKINTTQLENKLDQVIFAIDGISIDSPSFDTTSITAKLEEVSTSIRSTIIDASDRSAILSKLNSILQQFQKGGYVIADGQYVRTTIYDYIQGIYEKMGSGSGGGGGGVADATTIVDSIKSFQYDFDDTFSDLKQIYPVEALDILRNGSAFEWHSVDMINSVTPSVAGASASVYRLPDSLSVDVEENDGTFYLSNGGRLPVGLNYKIDGVWEYVELYNGDESNTVTGTDIIITDAFDDQPLSFEVFGKSTQNGAPSPANPVPVEGQWLNGLPYVHITSGSADGYTESYGHDFSTGGDPYGHGFRVLDGGNITDEYGNQWLCDVVDWCYDIPSSTYFGKYTKHIGSVTYDGSSDEDWRFGSGYTNPCFYVAAVGGYDVFLGAEILGCTYSNYVHANDTLAYGTPGYSLGGIRENVCGFFFSGFQEVGVIDMDSWLTYLSKHPITVYYELKEPEVYYSAYSYNEPKLSTTYNHITADYGSCMRISYATQSPYTALYSDTDGNWYKQRNDGSSTKITDSRVDTLNAAFNYKQYDNAADIKFNAGTNIIQVSSGDLTVDYIKGSKFFNWLYLYLSNFDGGSMDTDALLDKLDDIEDALSNMGGDIDIDNNLDFDISNDNDSYNVFYVTDPDTGEDTSIVDLTGDALTAFGRLLNFLYQIGFGDALENFGGTVDGLTDFYTDVGNGGVDVWAS